MDYNLIIQVQNRLQRYGAVTEAEICRLDSGLAMLPALFESDTGGAATAARSSSRETKSQGSVRIHGEAGVVAFRPDVLPFDWKTANLAHAVASDVGCVVRPAMFNPDALEHTRRQHVEAMSYTPRAVCARNAHQIEVKGVEPKCGPGCFQQASRQRLAG